MNNATEKPEARETADLPGRIEQPERRRKEPGEVREAVEKRLARTHGLTITRMQKRYSNIYRQCWEMRVALEAAVEKAYGKIDVDHAANINLAVRMEMHAKIVEHHVNKGDIAGRDVLSHIKASADFIVKRNTAIRRLKLIGAKERGEAMDDWDAVDGMMEGDQEVTG